jgi:hypothetical protein
MPVLHRRFDSEGDQIHDMLIWRSGPGAFLDNLTNAQARAMRTASETSKHSALSVPALAQADAFRVMLLHPGKD